MTGIQRAAAPATGPGNDRVAALEAELVRLRVALQQAERDTGEARAMAAALQQSAVAERERAIEAGRAAAVVPGQAFAALEASRTALAEKEEQLRLILENARDYAIFTSDPEDRITGWFAGAARVFGLSAAQALGRPARMLYVPEDQERGVPEQECALARLHGATPNVRWHQRQDGSRVFIDGTRTALRGAGGELRGFLKVGRDVTEQRESGEALRQSEERLRSATEVGRVALWDWDIPSGEIVWSDEHFRMEGYAVGEVKPSYETWSARLHPDDRAATEAALQRARETGREYAHEFRTLHPDGSVHWCSARGRFFYEADEPVRMVGAMVETTERREWEELQKVLMAELQHRTRNLIAVVRSLSNKTLAGSGSLAEYRRMFGARLEALSRVNGQLSRLDGTNRITFDELLRAELGAQAAIEDGDDAGQVVLDGPNGIRLRSSTVQTLALALHELTTNATKYGALAAPEGRLTVRWRLVPGTAEAQRLQVEWEERGVAMPSLENGAPLRRGYGRELIEQALPYQLGAVTAYHFGADGIRCLIELPISTSSGGPHD